MQRRKPQSADGSIASLTSPVGNVGLSLEGDQYRACREGSLDHLVGADEQTRWNGQPKRPRGCKVEHGFVFGRCLQWVRIGDSDSSPLARNVRRTGMVVGRVADRGGERQYGAGVHGPVGWTEISRHATQDEATAAAASWRPSR